MNDAYTPVAATEAQGPTTFSGNEMVVEAAGAADARFSDAAIHVLVVDAKTWARLDMPSVRVEGNATAIYFVIDVMAYLPGLSLELGHDGPMLLRKGAGFRLGVAAVGSELKATADIKTVAAMAHGKQVSITYKRTLLGLPASELRDVSLMGITSDDFGPAFLRSLDEAAAEITDFIATNKDDPDKVFPVTVGMTVIGGPKYDDRRILWSHLAALEGIYHRKTIPEQLGHVQYWSNRYGNELIDLLNPVVMQDVYAAFGVDDRPDGEQSDEAQHILRKGQTR